ncbi:hypothetical protein TTRE_0000555301 [Trichuris trichiura]|uniref:Uncharacterized protein n=1 Tax=Trichuris trichiura TaxID=36087 RepID=A0A077ZA45_TRITR|nr:hypothetical protein TTRE_0000555301 [Trichuris trichiura]
MASLLPNTREMLCNMEPLRIPRPQFDGMKFIKLNEQRGYYMTVRVNDKSPTDRPSIENVFNNKSKEEENDDDDNSDEQTHTLSVHS